MNSLTPDHSAVLVPPFHPGWRGNTSNANCGPVTAASLPMTYKREEIQLSGHLRSPLAIWPHLPSGFISILPPSPSLAYDIAHILSLTCHVLTQLIWEPTSHPPRAEGDLLYDRHVLSSALTSWSGPISSRHFPSDNTGSKWSPFCSQIHALLLPLPPSPMLLLHLALYCSKHGG
jgi:hypothetical protein